MRIRLTIRRRPRTQSTSLQFLNSLQVSLSLASKIISGSQCICNRSYNDASMRGFRRIFLLLLPLALAANDAPIHSTAYRCCVGQTLKIGLWPMDNRLERPLSLLLSSLQLSHVLTDACPAAGHSTLTRGRGRERNTLQRASTEAITLRF